MGDVVQLSEIAQWDSYLREHPGLQPDPEIGFFKPNAEFNRKLSLWSGDSTRLAVDAIVNAANTSLLGGGGIDGAIHRRAGPELLAETRTLGGCKTGQTKISGAYRLPCKYVLHTVGPIGENPTMLSSCYRTILQTAIENGIRTIAFCGVSTGAYGYPLRPAMIVAMTVIREWLEFPGNVDKVDRLILVTYPYGPRGTYETIERLVRSFFPPG